MPGQCSCPSLPSATTIYSDIFNLVLGDLSKTSPPVLILRFGALDKKYHPLLPTPHPQSFLFFTKTLETVNKITGENVPHI